MFVFTSVCLFSTYFYVLLSGHFPSNTYSFSPNHRGSAHEYKDFNRVLLSCVFVSKCSFSVVVMMDECAPLQEEETKCGQFTGMDSESQQLDSRTDGERGTRTLHPAEPEHMETSFHTG